MMKISPENSFTTTGSIATQAAGGPVSISRPSSPADDLINFDQPGVIPLFPESDTLSSIRRLVVLVPPDPFPVLELCKKIDRYTRPDMTILFVAQVNDFDQEVTAGRQIALLENLVWSPKLEIRSLLLRHTNWISAIKDTWCEGDLIFCLEDHKVQHLLFHSVSLGRKISTDLCVPVLLDQEIPVQSQSAWRKTVREFSAWASFAAIVALFSFLQIQTDRAVSGWLDPVLLLLSMIVEVGLIWTVNAVLR